MLKLFVDMDGTLAEFRPEATMEDMYTPGYFESLAPNKNVVEGLRIFKEEHPEVKVSVLSCILPERDRAREEKENWLRTYCPYLAYGENFFIPCGSDKAKLATEGDNFLLDDHSPNLISFERCGHGIKLMNGVNGQGIKWKGPRLAATLSPRELASSLYETIEAILAS